MAAVVKDNVSVDVPSSQLPAWVDLVLRIQKGDSIRSLPLTSKVINPVRPDFDEIQALVERSLTPKEPTPTESTPTGPSTSPTESPTGDPSPTSTPDDSEAEDLSATC